jgi:hypothetical protein
MYGKEGQYVVSVSVRGLACMHVHVGTFDLNGS